MQGYHLVRMFVIDSDEMVLPTGWKPFAILDRGGELFVICRFWKRGNPRMQGDDPPDYPGEEV